MVVSVVLGGFSDVRLKPHSGTVSAFARAQGGDNFILETDRDQINNYVRHGDDLIVEFADGQRLTIKDFFANGVDYHNLVLESETVRHFVDFARAVQTKDINEGDGIDESSLTHHAVHTDKQAAQSDDKIDYNTVSSIDSGEKQSVLSKIFSTKSVLSTLGGLGAIAAAVEYAFDGNDTDGDNGFINPFENMKDFEPLLPGDPHKESNADDKQEEPPQAASDLRFFTGYHLVESRIIQKNSNNDLYQPIFFMSVRTKDDAQKTDRALPFLESHQEIPNAPYQNVRARIHKNDVLAEGERIQLRVNGEDKWRDAVHDGERDHWKLKAEDIAELQTLGDLYQMDSRVIDAAGQTRQGGSFVYANAYQNSDRPAMAQIDQTLINDTISQIDGKIVGKFNDGDKIQIRFDGGGWYDVSEDAIWYNGQGFSWQYGDLPTYASSSNDDEIMLESGKSDTIFYRLLDEKDATGGNGFDTIYNFKKGKWGEDDVDRIDIASLLIDYNGNATHYLSAELQNNDTVLYLYRDGSTENTGLSPLVSLIGVQTTVQELYDNGQLIMA